MSWRHRLVTWNDLLEADAAGYQAAAFIDGTGDRHEGRLAGSDLLLAAFLCGVLRRGGQWRSVEQRVRQRLHQLHRDRADGVVDPLDGSFVSAVVLLDMERGLNHGRRRRVFGSLSRHEGGDRDRGDAADRAGPLAATARPKDDLDAQKVGFLRAGGWHIRKAGATGNPRGRPAKGVRGEDLLRQRIEQIAPGFDYQRASREERAELAAALLEPPRPVNRQALADFWIVDRSTVTRLNSLGRELLHQKSPKRGGASFSD